MTQATLEKGRETLLMKCPKCQTENAITNVVCENCEVDLQEARMEERLGCMMVIFALPGGFWAIVSFYWAINIALTPGYRTPLVEFIFAEISLLVVSILGILWVIILNRGFTARRPWARTLAIVLSVVMLLGFPVGTLFGIWFLTILNDPICKRLFGVTGDADLTKELKRLLVIVLVLGLIAMFLVMVWALKAYAPDNTAALQTTATPELARASAPTPTQQFQTAVAVIESATAEVSRATFTPVPTPTPSRTPSQTPTQTSASTTPETDTRSVTVGAFTVKVPTDWRSFSANEAAVFRRQFMAQSEEIYRQYTGSDDPSKTVDVIAFHISNGDGAFVIVSFTVPPQSDLITLLKSQVEDKMAWGVREGHIRKYLGLVPVDDEQFSGFYTKVIGNSGEIQISGGLEHRELKNTIIQLSLLCPKDWDEVKATNTLSSVLQSVMLREK